MKKMIELPEVFAIAKQMNEGIRGRWIKYGNCRNGSRKCRWLYPSPESSGS
jgi:hypothetical protein